MANRYWVGGSGIWSSTNTTNWSTSSGGTGGASVPTRFDVAVFDANSGAGEIVITASGDVEFSTLDTTARSGTLLTTFAGSGNMSMYGTANSYNVNNTTFGISGYLNMSSGGQVLVCGDDAKFFKNIRIRNGSNTTLLGSGSTVTLNNLLIGEQGESLNSRCTISSTGVSSANTVLVGNGTLNIGSYDYTVSGDIATNGAVNNISGSGTLVLKPATGSCSATINGSAPSIRLSPQETDSLFSFSGTGSVGVISRENIVYPITVEFAITSDLDCTGWTVEGQSGSIVTVKSSADGVRANITYTGAGLIETDYMRVRDMQPYPDNTWISFNSENLGNNWQWYFDEIKKPVSNLFFGSHV